MKYGDVQQEQSYPRETKPVNVVVRVTDKGELIVEPRNLILDVDQRQVARWSCAQGSLEVRFQPNNTPFQTNSFRVPRTAASFSGLPRREVKPGTAFQYTVLVTTRERFLLRQDLAVGIVNATTGNVPFPNDNSGGGTPPPKQGGLMCRILCRLQDIFCEK